MPIFDNELPLAWNARSILARTSSVVVATTGGQLYSNGFRVNLSLRSLTAPIDSAELWPTESQEAAARGRTLQLGVTFGLRDEVQTASVIDDSGTIRGRAAEISFWVEPRPQGADWVKLTFHWSCQNITDATLTLRGQLFSVDPDETFAF